MANLRTAHTCLYKSFFLIHSIQALPNSSNNKVVGHMDLFVSSVETKFVFTCSQRFPHFRVNVYKKESARISFNYCYFRKLELCLRKLSRKFARKILIKRQILAEPKFRENSSNGRNFTFSSLCQSLKLSPPLPPPLIPGLNAMI
jgi:hypothetical protein